MISEKVQRGCKLNQTIKETVENERGPQPMSSASLLGATASYTTKPLIYGRHYKARGWAEHLITQDVLFMPGKEGFARIICNESKTLPMRELVGHSVDSFPMKPSSPGR